VSKNLIGNSKEPNLSPEDKLTQINKDINDSKTIIQKYKDSTNSKEKEIYEKAAKTMKILILKKKELNMT
jgi:hypothetical protein